VPFPSLDLFQLVSRRRAYGLAYDESFAIKHLLDSRGFLSISRSPGGPRRADPREGVEVDEDRQRGARLFERACREERLTGAFDGAGLDMLSCGRSEAGPDLMLASCVPEMSERRLICVPIAPGEKPYLQGDLRTMMLRGGLGLSSIATALTSLKAAPLQMSRSE
jgi:hypothetical protein